MSDLILQLSEVMRAEVKSLDLAAHNAANLATPGYRSERTVLDGGGFLNQLTQSSPMLRAAISQQDGPLQITGASTDLAIRGAGWFALETPDGILLTRDGRFHLDSNGSLVGHHGYAVLAEQGVTFGLAPDFSVSADGSLTSHGQQTSKLRLVQARDGSQLIARGDGLYMYKGELSGSAQAAVIQGAYEMSNVDTAADMLHLMRTTRHIETLQRSISAYDQMLSTGINQLGK
jgi:flagellar basal body rod protein FlgG